MEAWKAIICTIGVILFAAYCIAAVIMEEKYKKDNKTDLGKFILTREEREKRMINEIVKDTRELLLQAGLDADPIMDKLEAMNYFTAPASSKWHLAHIGGLAAHSLNVAHKLAELTEKNGIQWENKRSPYIVGLLHDLCKCDQYIKLEEDEGYEYNKKMLLHGHGEKSVIKALQIIELTEEEILCIRYHMGAYNKTDWSGYDASIRKYPSVLWTHTADMIASKLMEG